MLEQIKQLHKDYVATIQLLGESSILPDYIQVELSTKLAHISAQLMSLKHQLKDNYPPKEG